MIDRIPLDSPLWEQVSACYSRRDAVESLRTVVATRQLGQAWKDLLGEALHQGDVYGISSAAIPHLVDLAPQLSVSDRRELWICVGLLIGSGADRFPSPPAAGLQEGLTSALRVAVGASVRDFLADTAMSASDAVMFAMACVSFARPWAGRDTLEAPYLPMGYVRGTCPGCEAGLEIDGFCDPFAPPCPAPDYQPTGTGGGPWSAVADSIDDVRRAGVLGAGWDDFLAVASRVARNGLPPDAPAPVMWCLVAAMLATRPVADAPRWARAVFRCAGHVRCPGCDLVWSVADVVAVPPDAHPVTVTDRVLPDRVLSDGVQTALLPAPAGAPVARVVPVATVADPVSGFRPAPGWTPRGVDVPVRIRWRAEAGAVDTVAVVPGRPGIVAAGTARAVTYWDLETGAAMGPASAGGAVALAAVAVADRHLLAVAGADGALRWWDPGTGRRIGRDARGPAPLVSLAAITMPAEPADRYRTVGWMSAISDGRTVLAAGDQNGAVRLWDSRTRNPLPQLFQRAGQPVLALATGDAVAGERHSHADLVAIFDDLTVDVWSSHSVHGQRSTMAPSRAKLAAAGHRHIVGAAPSVTPGRNRPMLLADRNGTTSMWETFGIRLTDPLPADPDHAPVTDVTTLHDSRGDLAVVTAGRNGLRVWYPHLGTVATIALDTRPRCLTTTGDRHNPTVIVGHDTGLLALALDQPVPTPGP
ncbi:WD40 repeat domain-containing protein [Virgisporangium aurantiacum]|uniref:WD40 repeat domain-containing protein n=1 Tax=Virgisporangium aurantiacum TaxID=175570 RepID=UPI00194ECB67|nr:WD40 repeat domain-containing protein [Virgisporangium aurantiacum]